MFLTAGNVTGGVRNSPETCFPLAAERKENDARHLSSCPLLVHGERYQVQPQAPCAVTV